MEKVIIDGRECAGDDVPKSVTRVYPLRDGTELHVTLTREGVVYVSEGREIFAVSFESPTEVVHRITRSQFRTCTRGTASRSWG